ncbi:hypothetical protein FNF29_08362 [Cafeteria roenbergensis]|uniref:DDE-1 domain-containing protein n=1 Tax=Cafeteria roenbergensis TaxID=33653 RepID=A0A5A8BYU8_CAFRO|nr:hypothetical protein FNF29_08362 [Cafeteria roenbergensis]|eukprot:KAA0145876.1 hypothetical protein FNF29_08362 [Cafeteria roenbergensis]
MHTDGTLHLFFASSNGWVTRSIFREAMHRWTAWEQIQDSDWEKRPKLLLMDGHAAHTDVASIKHLQDVGMRCAVPPGASSHMWQVLDNGPIGVFRKEFAQIRLGAAAATLTGAVPCPATMIGLRKGVTSLKVFAELEVDSGEGKTSGIFVRLKDARKTKVHPSDTLCAGYHAWVAAATPAVLAGGFVRTGTFAKGFTPDSKPTCDPEKILERMEAHRGGYDRDAIAAAVVERAMKSISDKSVLTPEFTSRMKKELDIIRVATNYGFADDVDGPNRAKRMALDLDNRQLVARTTDDFLRGNERYERHQRQLDVTDAHVNQIEAQARADHVLKSLRGLLEQAKRANAKARTTLKTISGTDVAQQASTSLAMIDSVLNTQATPTKAALKRDLLLDSPAASLVMDKLRLVKQLVFVGLQVASVSGALAPTPPSPGAPAGELLAVATVMVRAASAMSKDVGNGPRQVLGNKLLAKALKLRGCVAVAFQQLDTAARDFEQCGELCATLLGDSHVAVADLLVNLARVRSQQRKHAESGLALDRALAILRGAHGPDSQVVRDLTQMRSLEERRFSQGHYLACYEAGMRLRRTGDQHQATSLFLRCLSVHPGDSQASLMAASCLAAVGADACRLGAAVRIDELGTGSGAGPPVLLIGIATLRLLSLAVLACGVV